jgi:hypothetical protein
MPPAARGFIGHARKSSSAEDEVKVPRAEVILQLVVDTAETERVATIGDEENLPHRRQ